MTKKINPSTTRFKISQGIYVYQTELNQSISNIKLVKSSGKTIDAIMLQASNLKCLILKTSTTLKILIGKQLEKKKLFFFFQNSKIENGRKLKNRK